MGFALYVLWVINVHPASAGPDMLLLLLKALISISAPFSPVSSPTNSSQSDNPTTTTILMCNKFDYIYN